MTVHELLHLPVRQILMSVHFLLFAAQMALLFTAVRDKRSNKVRLSLAIHALLSLVIFYLMTACTFRNFAVLDLPGNEKMVFTAFGSFPVAVLILYELLTAASVLWALRDITRYRKRVPTGRSIKETIDLLPVGITFQRKDGSTTLHNLVMEELSRKANGKVLASEDVFHADASVWQISSEEVTVEGEDFTQITASDITRQSAITDDLAKKNEKLRDIHLRLDIYNKQAERMIIAKELLAARMTVHSEVGNVLLESRHYLNDPASFDEKMLLRALKNTNTYLLREYEEDDSAGDPLPDALEMADAIGVEVTIAGITPQTDPYRSILAAAIIECATNTVKHADGNELRAEIHEKDQDITYILSGNGKQPQAEIRESGGLKSLRSLVEKEGGTMEIQPLPAFTVCMSLPRKDSTSVQE